MTTEIEQIIKGGESETVEFKESTGQLTRAVETLCALANHKGGTLIFGVSRKGMIIGQTVAEATLRKISDEISRVISPPIYPSIIHEEVHQKSLIVITLPECIGKPHMAYDRAYKRVGTTTRPMSQQEYERLLLERNRHELCWDKERNDVTLSEIDAEQLRSFLQTARSARNMKISEKLPVRQILTGLEMMSAGKLTNAAIALFGKRARYHFTQLEVKAARFKGLGKDEFIDNKIFTGNLFELYEKIQDFFSTHVQIAGKFEEGSWSRKDVPEYPFLALREAVINMLIHRDYYNTSGSMEIAIYDDRIETWNIGMLPSEITPKSLYKPHRSVLRNPLLAHAFFLKGDIEKWGRGTLRIVEICKEAGLPLPEFSHNSGGLEVRFRSGKNVPKPKPVTRLNKTQQRIFEYLNKHGEASTNELMDRLDISRRSVQRNIKGMATIIKWTGKSPTDPQGKYIL